jgi:hypothetical protein
MALDNNNTLWDLYDTKIYPKGINTAKPIRIAENVLDISQRFYLLKDGKLIDRLGDKTIAENISSFSVDFKDNSTAALDQEGNLWLRANQGKPTDQFKKIASGVETLVQNGYLKKDKSFYTWGSLVKAPQLLAKNVDKIFTGFNTFTNSKIYLDAPLVQGFICDANNTYLYSQNNAGKIADFRISSANQLDTSYFTLVREGTKDIYAQLGQNCGVTEWKIKKASVPFAKHTKLGYQGTDGQYYQYDSIKYKFTKTNFIAPRIKADGNFVLDINGQEQIKLTHCAAMDYILIPRTSSSNGRYVEHTVAVTRLDGSLWIGFFIDSLSALRPLLKAVNGISEEDAKLLNANPSLDKRVKEF